MNHVELIHVFVAQDPYLWKTSINIMQLRETMGYTSQVENYRADQEWGMRMFIKISKSLTKTHLKSISSECPSDSSTKTKQLSQQIHL